MVGERAQGGAEAALRVGVFGTGALGFHHVRLCAALPGADLVGVHDVSPAAAGRAAEAHGARVFADPEELAAAIDAAVVAVPTVAHEAVAAPLLARGVHCLVEKPIAPDLESAGRLIAAAEEGGAVLGVGHVEFYNPAVQALLAARPGARFVEVQRLGVFSPRSLDVDVVLDLMIHDLQILQALDRTRVAEVRATGLAVLSDRIDIANARVAFASGCVANVTASRVSSERARKLRLFSPNRYYSLDYQAQEIKGYELGEPGTGVEAGAFGERAIVPADLPVTGGEPLKAELEAFFARCRGERVPFVDGEGGARALATALDVMRAIEA